MNLGRKTSFPHSTWIAKFYLVSLRHKSGCSGKHRIRRELLIDEGKHRKYRGVHAISNVDINMSNVLRTDVFLFFVNLIYVDYVPIEIGESL